VSPDGKYIAYSAGRVGQGFAPLWIRRLDSVEAKMIPNTDNAQQPLWSPDSQTIAFFADDKLKKVDVNGGPVQTLCNVLGQNFTGTWNRDGVILFGTQDTKGIQRISSSGGLPVQVTSVQAGQETAHLYPQFLADEDHFVYRAVASGLDSGNTYIASLHTADRKLLFKSDSSVGFSPPDRLLFLRDGALLTQQINLKTLELIGEPVGVAESVAIAANGRSGFSVSQNGIVAYSPGTNAAGESLQFVWVDRAGMLLSKVGPQAVYRSFDLSHDLKQIATHREEGSAGGDI
jgi:WD40-like Beta Propeller Repeat